MEPAGNFVARAEAVIRDTMLYSLMACSMSH